MERDVVATVLYAVYDFSIRLSQNGSMNQFKNHYKGSWGHIEHESGGVCRKLFDFYF